MAVARMGDDRMIGFIGTGIMGSKMAHNLSKSYKVIAYDANSERLQKCKDVIKAGSIRELATMSNIVFLSLPTSRIVKEVTIGKNGLINWLKKDSTVIDTSTIEPSVAESIGNTLGQRKIHFLDAPVSGGELAASNGTLSFMVGGNEKVFIEVKPLLEIIGKSVVLVGENGNGAKVKLINNLIVGITFAAVCEGFALGKKSGLNLKILYNAIKGGWASSTVLEVASQAILNNNYQPGGSINIHWKDLGYALDFGKAEDVPIPVTSLVHEIFKAARASGRGEMSQPAIIKLWEDILSIQV